jgi:signal peptide peptidase SppA
MRHLRLAERLFNQPLMISEAKLNVIQSVFARQSGLALSGAAPAGEMIQVSEEDQVRAGYTAKNGVGVIGIYGPLMHRVLDMEFPSGGPTTYSDIRGAFDLALADDAVQGIVLDIDSPGGEVCGVFDLADHIFQARGIKPITAVVNESAYSAAYLLASAAERIVIPRTGGAGSIGVIATHADFSRAEDEAGITVTHVYAGARKADFSPHMALSPEAAAILQRLVDDTYALFVDTVAHYRGMNVKDVRGTQAGLYVGKKAVAAKLADRVMPVDQALTDAPRGKGTRLVAASHPKKEQHMTIEELRQEQPELVAQLEAEARQGLLTEAQAKELSAAAVDQALAAAEAPPEKADAAAVIALCDGAGLSFLAAEAIKGGLSLEAVHNRIDRANDCKDVLVAAKAEPTDALLLAAANADPADVARHVIDVVATGGKEISGQHTGKALAEQGVKSPNHTAIYAQYRPR